MTTKISYEKTLEAFENVNVSNITIESEDTFNNIYKTICRYDDREKHPIFDKVWAGEVNIRELVTRYEPATRIWWLCWK